MTISKTRISTPLSRNLSTTCEPMKPEPPVTNTFIQRSLHSAIPLTFFRHPFRFLVEHPDKNTQEAESRIQILIKRPSRDHNKHSYLAEAHCRRYYQLSREHPLSLKLCSIH